MSLIRFRSFPMVWGIIGVGLHPASYAPRARARRRGMMKGAYQRILRSCDANKDGKLTVQKCMGAPKDKARGGKDCRYWDADGEGITTEEEYISRARKIMN